MVGGTVAPSEVREVAGTALPPRVADDAHGGLAPREQWAGLRFERNRRRLPPRRPPLVNSGRGTSLSDVWPRERTRETPHRAGVAAAAVGRPASVRGTAPNNPEPRTQRCHRGRAGPEVGRPSVQRKPRGSRDRSLNPLGALSPLDCEGRSSRLPVGGGRRPCGWQAVHSLATAGPPSPRTPGPSGVSVT